MSISYNASFGSKLPSLYLDAGNIKSYSGSGTIWSDLSINKSSYAGTYYTYPTWSTNYFIFVNNGTTQNNIYSSSQNLSTSSLRVYTRIGWFKLTGTNSWSPIIQNQIGNNSDMGLTVSGGKLHFRQYSKTQSSGTSDGDYGVSGSLSVNTNTWYQGAIVVNRNSNQVTFYLNGLLDSIVSINTLGNSASDTIIIGGCGTDSYSGDRMFKGYIGQVFHYNSLLTADEIKQNFNAFRGRYGI